MALSADVVVAPTRKLYPAQLCGVDRFMASAWPATGPSPGPRRHILPWGTGCGKTVAGVTIIDRLWRQYGQVSTLIVCPAIVRSHWLAHLSMQDFCTPALQFNTGLIEWGRERKLSVRRDALRAQAYASPIQVVSYDLLHEVDRGGWGLVVFDELHHLAQPLSKQSKAAEDIVAHNPHADILGLSATLIPTEVKQLWNPLRLLFGDAAWGKPARNGDVSWDFQFRYCKIERSEYGTRGYGLNQEHEAELRDRLMQVCSPLNREDIRADMPPLDAHVYQLPQLRGKNALRDQLIEWHDALPDDVIHRVIMVRHRELARSVFEALNGRSPLGRPVRYIDGSLPTDLRHIKLLDLDSQASATLVCTWESLSEGIRLMWAQQVAIAEWPQSPGRLAQLMGRFNSVGSDATPQVHLMCQPDSYGAATTLLNRIQAVMSTLGTSNTNSSLQKLIRATQYTEATADDWAALFSTQGDDAWQESEPEA